MSNCIDIKINSTGYEKFIKKLKKENDCIVWVGAKTKTGYGIFRCMKINYRAHRVAYFLHYGNISNDLVLDHICRNRACCNPLHLREVTQTVNARENTLSVKSYCKNGHEFTNENTYLHKDSGRIKKRCKICCNQRNKKYRESDE
jgi:hypothetical protein